MRTQRVVTNLRCNQACAYCTQRSPTDDRAYIAPAAVRARLDEAARAGAHDLVLTGGEPSLRRDLVELVAHAAPHVERVVLETNATTLDAAAARALAEAGLGLARVNLTAWGAAADALTRDPGGFERTRAGIDALASAGVPIEIAMVVVRSTAGGLTDLVGQVCEALGAHLRAIVVDVPTESPTPSELLTFEEAARVILDVDRAARSRGVPVRLADGSALVPCVFEPKREPVHFFSMTPGGAARADRRHIDACAHCLIVDRCAGFPDAYLARDPSPRAWPIEQERVRRRLSLISDVQAQIERELVSPNLIKAEDGTDCYEEIIRVNFRCNQACHFCFVSTHLPAASDARVEAAIRAAASKGARITLSGGEPTLNPKLVHYVRLACSLSREPIQLQTNALLLADPERARELIEAGVDKALVSLHGSTAAISDAITGAPGTFDGTVLGIDHLVALGVPVVINFVICRLNHHDLPRWVTFCGLRWPNAILCVSFVAASTDVVPRDEDTVPRYSDVLPYVAEALAEAERLGVAVEGFESMCGLPLCLVPAGLDRFFDLRAIPPGFDGGEFEKPPPCQRCAMEARCYGLRSGYRALHGDDELLPFAP